MTLIGITRDKDMLFVQALLLLKKRGILIDHCHYIKTNQEEITEELAAFWHQNEVDLKISHFESKGIATDESSYFQLENEVFKWYTQCIKRDKNIFVFVGGGHTLLNLAIQKAAYLFGCTDAFHMLINVSRNEEPNTIAKTTELNNEDKILYVSMGQESGWPALNYLKATDNLSQQIRALTRTIENRSVDHINEYPFECINLLPSKAVEFLNTSLKADDLTWIKKLPKVELHCHLGGFAVRGDLLKEIRKAADTSFDIQAETNIKFPLKWPRPDQTVSLQRYMALGDNNGSSILKNTGCLKKQIQMLYAHLLDQNIRYAEIRCSPYNYRTEEKSAFEVLKIMVDEFDKCMENSKFVDQKWCHVNLLVIGTRKKPMETRSIDDHISLALVSESNSRIEGKCKVVGIDLAGFEHPTTRASYYNENFQPIHRAGIALTVHAGENDESEAIWEAVFKLNTRRIGHGLNLYQDQQLLRSIVNRKIGIEMCPYANFQIKGYYPMENKSNKYPLLDYLHKGAMVTVNTDNIGISEASLSENILFLHELNPGITKMNVLQLLRNGLEQAFVEAPLKNKLLKTFNEEIFTLMYYNEVL